MAFTPPTLRAKNGELNAPMLGKLECIRQQIFQHLLQTFRIRGNAPAQLRVRIMSKESFLLSAS